MGGSAARTEWEAAQIIGIVFLSINLLLFVPYLSWSTYRYYKQKNHNLAIIKRRPNIVLICSVISIVYIITYKSAYILLRINAFEQDLNSRRLTLYLLQICNQPVSVFPLHFSLFRFWLLYYDVIWYKLSINNQWQSVLNPSLNEKNWFFQNKHTYGNPHWLKYRYFAVSALIITLKSFNLFMKYFARSRNYVR